MAENSENNAYWAANIRLVTICLVIWALASYGMAILFRPLLNSSQVGADISFWFAQQGSILVFLVLIFFYAFRMNSIDKQHGVDE